MGWALADAPDHEGFLVALRRESWRLVELLSTDLSQVPVAIQAACDCGWRSPFLAVPIGSWYHPGSGVVTAEYISVVGRALWTEHVRQAQQSQSMFWLPASSR